MDGNLKPKVRGKIDSTLYDKQFASTHSKCKGKQKGENKNTTMAFVGL